MSRLSLCSAVVFSLAASPGEAAEEVLALDDAIAVALQNNRSIQNAALQVESAEADIDAARTRRLPNFDLQLRAAQLVTPVGMEFPAGAFGDYPGIGPIPSVDTRIESATEPAGYVSASVAQPLSQLHRIGLGVKMRELSRDADLEKLRSAKQSLVASVKSLYYSLLQTESALQASREQLNLYRELDRMVAQYVSEETALKSEGMDVKARLAAEEYESLSLQNALAAQKERLNDLMGRDIRTPFSIVEPLEPKALETDLDAAQAQALSQRSEIREAQIQIDLADTDRRYKKAEFIPDVSFAFMFTSFVNVQLLPQNVAMLGLELKWEPFDWGRKSNELAAKTRSLDQARNAARDVETRILMEVAANFRKLQEARALVTVRALSRDSASEKMRVAVNRHKEQSALLKDVLEAQATHAESNAQYQQALMSLWTARADFEKSLGED